MDQLPAYTIFPLGDSALVVDFGNTIDLSLNKFVHAIFHRLQHDPIPGLIESVPAYSSLTVYYDVLAVRKKIYEKTTAYDWMAKAIRKIISSINDENENVRTPVKIPVCYDKKFAPDLDVIAEQNEMAAAALIQLHTSKTYRVYMLGFLPGFPYMDMIDEKIVAFRKSRPVVVEAGSVGLAGKQTGIYPLTSPGGWQIIGRTPLKLFDKNKEDPVLFKAGDIVQFYSITSDEFENIKGRTA